MAWELGRSIIILLAGSLLCVLIQQIVVMYFEVKYLKCPEYIDMMRRHNMALTLIKRAKKRFADISEEIVSCHTDLRRIKRRHFLQNRENNDYKSASLMIRRVLEEETARFRGGVRPKKFIARIINRHVETAISKSRPHPWLLPYWGTPQDVVIWGINAADARNEADRAYSPTQGFEILEIVNNNEAKDPQPTLAEVSDLLNDTRVAKALGMSTDDISEMAKAESSAFRPASGAVDG